MPAFLFFVANAVVLWHSIFDETDPIIYSGIVLIFLSAMTCLGVLFRKFNDRK